MEKVDLYEDLLMEYVASYLMDVYNLTYEDLRIKNIGIFNRFVSKDIESIYYKKFATYSTLNISINREGIYDALPEALFHSSKSFNAIQDETLSSFKENTQKLKDEEKSARLFFSMLESEILKTFISVGRYEKSAKSFQLQSLKKSIYRMFPFDLKDYTEEEKLKLFKILQHVNSLYAESGYQCLNSVLYFLFEINTEISLDKKPKTVSVDKNAERVLGKFILGLNTSIGETIKLYSWELNVKIIIDKNPKRLFENTLLVNKINDIISWIIPYYINVNITKHFDGKDVVLGNDAYKKRLSYMTLG